ncbi:hypothetical protein C900_05455 [Fulvivirga imtechensis AK7]|uniref:Uncharacterized protein n=1 Tax=Fulvivirga imtechensis AK7 TaxID=1237149 RepID=L8JJI2_9BACT|nr:hypothetical protein [Fulvivirga imtechensis]ELR69066.1 hypothetical protein C900_05455 [Fulvivirga imtechensis AK7]
MRYITIPFLYLTTFFISIHSQAQIVSDMDDESKLYAETKQVNQFFRRFNGEEDERGERYYSRDKEFRSPKLRKNYITILFDADNRGIHDELKKEFIEYVTNRNNPVILDFHEGEWFSEVTTTFNYKGKDRTFILFMKLEQERLGYKWVISKVYSDAFRDYLKRDTTQHGKFLHPLSHELDFMNLRKVFQDESTVDRFVVRDYKPDYLSLFLYEIKMGNLKFKTIRHVKFHFFQIDNWYFELSEFNRPGYNTGWLISNLVKVADKDKDLLRKYIYYEDK